MAFPNHEEPASSSTVCRVPTPCLPQRPAGNPPAPERHSPALPFSPPESTDPHRFFLSNTSSTDLSSCPFLLLFFVRSHGSGSRNNPSPKSTEEPHRAPGTQQALRHPKLHSSVTSRLPSSAEPKPRNTDPSGQPGRHTFLSHPVSPGSFYHMQCLLTNWGTGRLSTRWLFWDPGPSWPTPSGSIIRTEADKRQISTEGDTSFKNSFGKSS